MKVVVITIPVVIVAFLIFAYLLSLSYTSSEEIDKKIDEQVENLQTKHSQDFREEIREYPAYRIVNDVLGEPSVKEMYRDYLEALNYGSESDANNMFDRYKSYVETRTETKFRQEYPLESFTSDLGDLIFGK